MADDEKAEIARIQERLIAMEKRFEEMMSEIKSSVEKNKTDVNAKIDSMFSRGWAVLSFVFVWVGLKVLETLMGKQ